MNDIYQQSKEEKEKLRLIREEIRTLLREALPSLKAAKEKCGAASMWKTDADEIAEIEDKLEKIIEGLAIIEWEKKGDVT